MSGLSHAASPSAHPLPDPLLGGWPEGASWVQLSQVLYSHVATRGRCSLQRLSLPLRHCKTHWLPGFPRVPFGGAPAPGAGERKLSLLPPPPQWLGSWSGVRGKEGGWGLWPAGPNGPSEGVARGCPSFMGEAWKSGVF